MVYQPEAAAGRWRPAGIALTVDGYAATARTTISSRDDGFAAEQKFCGWFCGKVLLVGLKRGPTIEADSAELYNPVPAITGLTPTRASPGAEITITGAGFSPGTKVLFAGQEAATTVDSYSTLRAIVPPGAAGLVAQVMVVNDGGPTLAPSFTYLGQGLPGGVGELVATAVSEVEMKLDFAAAGAFGEGNPPATDYLVRQSRSPIVTEADFAAAQALSCDAAVVGLCRFAPGSVGQALEVLVGGLSAGTVYHYAVRAVNANGLAGPMSTTSRRTLGQTLNEVSDNTGLDVDGCQVLGDAAANQLRYPKGYSLISLPAGTRPGARSNLYSWFNQGSGGSYKSSGGDEPVEAGRGYWAWSPCPRLVDMAGPGSSSASFVLDAYRASMVGNPSAQAPATISGHDFTARWDPSLNDGAGGYHISGYQQRQNLAIGEGIWAFSYVSTEIHVAEAR